MVTTSSLEDLEVDLNGAMSNYLRLVLLVLTYFLHFPTPEYANMIKRLCRTLLYMYSSRSIYMYIDYTYRRDRGRSQKNWYR